METFRIHNTARAQHTRAARTAAPGRARMKMHIGGELRVLRAQPLVVSEETLMKHMKELTEKQMAGQLEVRTMDGRLLDLVNQTVSPGKPKVLPPHPPLDSANNDKNQGVGEFIPQFAGGVPTGTILEGGEAGIPGPLGPTEVADAQQAEHEAPEEEFLLDDPADGEEEVPADTAVTGSQPSKKKNKRK